MADFNKYYDDQSKLLPDVTSVAAWLDNETWKRIIQRAGQTLALLEK